MMMGLPTDGSPGIRTFAGLVWFVTGRLVLGRG